MGIKCRLFGHKFNYYSEDVIQHIYSNALSKTFPVSFNTQFRICKRCQFKQVREHFTDRVSDWSYCELSKEQLREKKLKELGI